MPHANRSENLLAEAWKALTTAAKAARLARAEAQRSGHDIIGPDKFLDIAWRIAPYNPNLYYGDSSTHQDLYELIRKKVDQG